MTRGPLSLRTDASWQVLEGFGRAVRAACRTVAPTDQEELLDVLDRAKAEGLSVTFRGHGRSYGDAALNADGLVIDMTLLNRMLRWDPVAGIAEMEPGLTIEGLWRRTLEDGWWPAVVPGTMWPTMGGCLSMNVHGKNNFAVGTFGEHVLDFDLVTPRGEWYRCSPRENADIFYGAIGGLGLLGAITRVRLQMKQVDSGLLRVEALTGRNLDEVFDRFEQRLPESDYLVGWLDCLARGSALGRGVLHRANYITREEDAAWPRSFHTEQQRLPDTILGLPRSQLWRLMRPFVHNPGVRLINSLKYQASAFEDGVTYLQSHVAFAFLLDYVPDWRLAYGDGGFIQYQVFIGHEAARSTLKTILTLCQKKGLPSYLGVLKRHRPDPFLLSHALDGWSLAMDFRVTRANREALWALTREMTACVLDAGGRFYFAKDAVLQPDEVRRAYGGDRLDRFAALKARLDPDTLLVSDLARRALPSFSPRYAPAHV